VAGRILIVDDDDGFRRALSRALGRAGYDVSECDRGADAADSLLESDADVVLLDYQLPDVDGLSLLDELTPKARGAAFLMVTAYPDLEVAVEAMRRGAFDYVAKGAELRELLMRIERAAEVASLRRRMAEASQATQKAAMDALIGESAPMVELRKRVAAVAKAEDTTALVLGETGTGKGVVARMIHAQSSRAYEPLVAVDCSTIPVNLVESELLGHERGSFTGATSSKQGRVEAAARGTLFLDEIGELELPMQTKLLRLLEEKEFTRVGSTRARKMTARVIAATNRDLSRAVAEGRFRADLRYRLEVFVVETPPLRTRGDDILSLAAHFVRDRARALGRATPEIGPDLTRALFAYPYPGNVRELRNMVEQAMLLNTEDVLTLDDFPVLGRAAGGWEPPPRERPSVAPPPYPTFEGRSTQPFGVPLPANPLPANPLPPSPLPPSAPARAPSHPAPLDTAMASAPASSGPPSAYSQASMREEESLEAIRARARRQERTRVLAALEQSAGNVTAAAKQMGLSRYQMMRLIKKHGLR
jgi:DNA-binding NtrC family response regulator